MFSGNLTNSLVYSVPFKRSDLPTLSIRVSGRLLSHGHCMAVVAFFWSQRKWYRRALPVITGPGLGPCRQWATNSSQRLRWCGQRILKGLCHQIRIAWKWYCFKGLGTDMIRLIFKILLSEPLIFNRHLKFLCLGSKSIQIFHFVLNLIWGCSIAFEFALFASWMLQDLVYLGPEQRLRRLLSSICVQNLYRATQATFRAQKEQWL